MYLILLLFVREQASSLIPADAVIGCIGVVTTSIDPNAVGEVGVSAGGEYRNYSARATGAQGIEKGRRVRVARMAGGVLIVEEIQRLDFFSEERTAPWACSSWRRSSISGEVLRPVHDPTGRAGVRHRHPRDGHPVQEDPARTRSASSSEGNTVTWTLRTAKRSPAGSGSSPAAARCSGRSSKTSSTCPPRPSRRPLTRPTSRTRTT